MGQARSRKIKGSALKSFFQESVNYTHQSKFAHHVGTSTLGRTNNAHCIQTQLTESCLTFGSR